jgi:DNA modification methylase
MELIEFTQTEEKRYHELKNRCKAAWIDFANAIIEIRDSKLYRVEYNTFEDFCNSELAVSVRYAQMLTASAEVVANITNANNCSHLPQTESQTRPLTRLEPELQPIVWADVVENNEEITAKKVEQTISDYEVINEAIKEEKRIEVNIFNPDPQNPVITNRLAELSKMPIQEQLKAVKEIAKEIRSAESNDKRELIEKRKQEYIEILNSELSDNKPKVYNLHYADFFQLIDDNSVDLLITDPPYSTDVEDIASFAEDWLPIALSKIKNTGRAFICIGAYPSEIQAYLNVLLKQDKFIVDNPLIWTYKNTLGLTPKMKYNLNYQVILHLYSENSKPLDTSITNEMFSVQEINAPDGRVGNRFHTWQKPDELALRLIKHSTNEGDSIIDCFACTGTFLLMAAKLNRSAVGCDISAENLEIAEERGCIIAGKKI